MRQLVQSVNKVRKNVHWYLICPKEVKEREYLKEDRVTVLPSMFTEWANKNRFHFDVLWLKKIMNMNYDFDVFLNSQPELSSNFYNIMNPSLQDKKFSVPIINYLHWLSVPENQNYQIGSFLRQVEGILYSKFSAVNSKWVKKIFLQNIEKEIKTNKEFPVSEKLIDITDEKLHPLTLGTPLEEMDKYRKLEHDEFNLPHESEKVLKGFFEELDTTKTIVFNHRLMKYTGADHFLRLISKLHRRRKDFNILITDPNYKTFFKKEKFKLLPIFRANNLGWNMYTAVLSRCHFGVGFHTKYCAWSLSTVDTMSVCRPVLVPSAFAYPEIVGHNYKMTFTVDPKERESSFLGQVNFLLDNEDSARKIGLHCRNRVEKCFDWKVVVNQWLDVLEKHSDMEFYGNETETMKKLAKMVQEYKRLEKKQIYKMMNWSFNISGKVAWLRYRRYLLTHDIAEEISSPEVVFTSKTEMNES